MKGVLLYTTMVKVLNPSPTQRPTNMSSAFQVSRLGEGHYEVTDTTGRVIPVQVADTDILHFARVLGFDQWYPDLEDHIEDAIHSDFDWIGMFLIADEKEINRDDE